MVEHVQIRPDAGEPVRGRRLLVLVAVLNGVLAMIWVCGFEGLYDAAWVFAPVVALVGLPLMMRSWPSFWVTCLLVAALLLVLGVVLFIVGLFLVAPSALILLLATTPLPRVRPVRGALLLTALVVVPWTAAFLSFA